MEVHFQLVQYFFNLIFSISWGFNLVFYWPKQDKGTKNKKIFPPLKKKEKDFLWQVGIVEIVFWEKSGCNMQHEYSNKNPAAVWIWDWLMNVV